MSDSLLVAKSGLQPMAKAWRLLAHDRAAIAHLAEALHVAPIVAQILLNRGLGEPSAAKHFLDAPLMDLHPPDLLPGAVAAAERLFQAVGQKRRICVFGDYDVDGITGTAILWKALRMLDATVEYYLPHRLDEGYGLNSKALRQIAQSGASLVITVDCGIAALAEAEEARRLGLELIVTDHHQPKESLPDAAVIVHPRLPGGMCPSAELSGAGVAFKVAWKLCQLACGSEKVTPVFREFLLDSVALAALGLVADVVPLKGENRVFVRHGLARLERVRSLGLQALFEATGLAAKAPLLADDVSYKLAPRLNAAGRLGPAGLVVELLTTASRERAVELARNLELSNQQRQQLERRTLIQAREQLATNGHKDAPALVLASAEWHPGVIGIVAGRLAEQFGRPALMIALLEFRGLNATSPAEPLTGQDEVGRSFQAVEDYVGLERPTYKPQPIVVGHGSARSVPGLALHEALQDCGDLLLSHGGHAAAAGFRIQPDRIDAFRERICVAVTQRLDAGLPPPSWIIDAEVPLSALTLPMLKDLGRLEPYGSDNRRPLFLAGPLQVVGSPTKIGKGERHLGFRVRQENTTLRAVAFSMGDRAEELMSAGGQCCLVFTPRVNEWQGFRRVEIEVLDFQAGPRARLA
jgi:single-stranded-DNA-specific exonuclease